MQPSKLLSTTRQTHLLFVERVSLCSLGVYLSVFLFSAQADSVSAACEVAETSSPSRRRPHLPLLESEDLQDSPPAFDPKVKKRRCSSDCPGPASDEESQRFAYNVIRRMDDDGRDLLHLFDVEVLVTSKWSGAATGEIAIKYLAEAMMELYGWTLQYKFLAAWECHSFCQDSLRNFAMPTCTRPCSHRSTRR